MSENEQNQQAEAQAPQFAVQRVYLKDASLESPNCARSVHQALAARS